MTRTAEEREAHVPSTIGIDHVAVTVSDLEASVTFYTRLWGSGPVAELSDGPFTRRIFALPGGTKMGLTQHDDAAPTRFDPTRPGLDHFGFAVSDRAELAAWVNHLDDLEIVHSDVVEADYGAALSFVDPDGVALEIFLPR